MRLDPATQDLIKREVASMFGDGSEVRLFGSRTDDAQRGGDIDLLIHPARPVDNVVTAECRLTARLQIALGGRKVDVLLETGKDKDQPVIQQAYRHGILL